MSDYIHTHPYVSTHIWDAMMTQGNLRAILDQNAAQVSVPRVTLHGGDDLRDQREGPRHQKVSVSVRGVVSTCQYQIHAAARIISYRWKPSDCI